MGLLVPRPVLDPGETISFKKATNHREGVIARGGYLFMTQKRLYFEPHRLDRMLKGKSWKCDLCRIVDVDISPRDANVFAGGQRKRLRILLADGSAEQFVVNRIEHSIAKLREGIEHARGETDAGS